MRKMATIRRISAINPIPNADSIVVATVDGWRVVVKKGEFKVGEYVVYCEIDSFIPHELAPFLSKGSEPREFNSVKGERLRTVKLRGQISQGLLLPRQYALDKVAEIHEGMDVSDVLGIQKWEPPIPPQLAGEMRGLFPSFVPKTDQERVQNLVNEINQWQTDGSLWEITEKLDGTSMTVYKNGEDSGVCSRNLSLHASDNNTYWKVARTNNLIDIIESQHENIAIQGEIIGEGIQGNPYKLRGQHFYLFDIYDIDNGLYWTAQRRQEFCVEHSIHHVPVIEETAAINGNIDHLLTLADGYSMLNASTIREGLVFKCKQDPDRHFKVISNSFLIKEK